MIRTEGFVDLRVSPSGQLATNEDSVWPSFTDVMTVIVMIFLLALVVILIRNMELVRQLRATMAYEQQVTTERTALELKTSSLGDEVAALHLKLGETEARHERAEAVSEKRQSRIDDLLRDVSALEQVRDNLTDERGQLTGERDNLEGELLSLVQKHQSLEALRLELENEVAALIGERTALSDEKAELIERNTTVSAARAQLVLVKSSLQGVQGTRESGIVALGNELSGPEP